MTHTKNMIVDYDPHFSVDAISRKIEYMSDDSLVLVQGDHNSERITFVAPRFVEGHDMLECNRVQIHYINTSSSNKSSRSSGVYEAADVRINPLDENTITFTWLLSSGTTLHVGNLSFVVRFACIEGTNVVYSWNTLAYSGVNVFETIDNINNMPTVYTDILENWYQELILAGELGMNGIKQTKEAALSEIEQAADAAIERINAVETIREIEQETIEAFEVKKTECITEIETTGNEVKGVLDAALADVNSAKSEAEEAVVAAETAKRDINDAASMGKTDIDSAVEIGESNIRKTTDSGTSEVGRTIEKGIETIDTTLGNAINAVTEQEAASKLSLQNYGNSILNNLENASVKNAASAKVAQTYPCSMTIRFGIIERTEFDGSMSILYYTYDNVGNAVMAIDTLSIQNDVDLGKYYLWDKTNLCHGMPLSIRFHRNETGSSYYYNFSIDSDEGLLILEDLPYEKVMIGAGQTIVSHRVIPMCRTCSIFGSITTPYD